MPDNKPSLEVSNDGKDLFLVDRLEEFQERFWFFTPYLETECSDLEKIVLKPTDNLIIKPIHYYELINKYGPGILVTVGIIRLTPHLLKPLEENCGVGYMEQICDEALSISEVLIDIIGGLGGGYLNLRFGNLKCDLIQSIDRNVECNSLIDVKIRKEKYDYEGKKYKPIVIKNDIIRYKDKRKDKTKLIHMKLLNLAAHIQKGINSLNEPFEFPYIIKKKTKDDVYYFIGLIKSDKEGKIELIPLSDEKGMPNGIGKSKAYRRKYEAINEISEKLRIKYGNLRK